MPVRFSTIKICGSVLCAVFSSHFCIGQNTPHAAIPVWTVQVRDLSPRFLDFYRTAIADDASPDRRWELWKEKYDFAAVPPIAAGQAIARRWLDEAWPKYQAKLPRITAGAADIFPSPQTKLSEVVSLLKPSHSGQVQVTVFVGTFHHDAFASGEIKGVWRIAIPLEESNTEMALSMTHEFTHAVQRSSGRWVGQTVGGAIFSEGLAMRVTEKLNPGFPPQTYTTSTKEWLDTCAAKLPEVFNDLEGHLNDTGAEAVSKFTLAKAGAGFDREIYCAGWLIVGRLLEEGRSFSELASLPQPDAVSLVAEQIKEWPTGQSNGTP